MSLISVLLAVYNGGSYLLPAIESIQNQTYKDWELIIVDNGSTDDTKSIAESAAVADGRIRVFSLPDKGKNRAYNYAFEKSSGDYFCFFAADDILPPTSLAQRLERVKEDPSKFSTCLLRTISEEPMHDGLVFPKNREVPNFSGGSIFFGKNLARMVFPIPVDLPNEDTWTSLHLRAFGKNSHLGEVLYYYRIHRDNSYGYGLAYEAKREKFLARMRAYELFYSRWQHERNEFIQGYIKGYITGLKQVKRESLSAILLIRGLSLADRLKFLLYSSPMLYKIRHKYFSFFSGVIN